MAAAEEATEAVEDGESLPVWAVVVGALTEDRRERTDEAVPVLPEASEELSDGGDPGGVVLNGIPRLCRMLFSALTEEDGFGRPVSSASLV